MERFNEMQITNKSPKKNARDLELCCEWSECGVFYDKLDMFKAHVVFHLELEIPQTNNTNEFNAKGNKNLFDFSFISMF